MYLHTQGEACALECLDAVLTELRLPSPPATSASSTSTTSSSSSKVVLVSGVGQPLQVQN
jgi:hypothetical protein